MTLPQLETDIEIDRVGYKEREGIEGADEFGNRLNNRFSTKGS